MTASPTAGEPARLGLVLSSGAAHGAAHAGVLQALESAGVRVDVLVGASAGALLGGAWAAGVPADEVAAWVSRASWASFGSARPNRRLGLLDTNVLRDSLDELFAGRAIENFPLRFGAVATDLLARTPVLLDHGSAADALRASTAVPGVFPPVRVDGRLLVDGAVTSPVPVWAARRLGARAVVAVSLRPDAPSRSHPWRSRILPPAPDDGPADLEIVVDTRQFSAWSPRDVPTLVELGRRAVEHALARIDVLAGADPHACTTSRP